MKFKGIVNAGECACGKEHGVNLDYVSVGHGVLEEIPEIAKRFSAGGRVELICDGNTFEAAGLRIKQYLDAQDVPSSICELHPRDHVVPDEKTVGDARASVSKDTRVLLAVGSGTITDITRIIAHEMHVPFISVPTAPSVDGYVSAISALTVNGVKESYPASPPRAVVADLDVLVNAPRKMKAAGFGDMLGKSTARMDWELTRIVNQEYYCARIAGMVQDALQESIRAFELGKIYDGRVIRSLMEGLLRSGLSVAMAGSSRPISGSEHHVSHFFEMKGLSGSIHVHLHGETVALGTYLVSMLYHEVFSLEFSQFEDLYRINRNLHPPAEREKRLLAVYGSSGLKMVESWKSTLGRRENAPAILSRLSTDWIELVRLKEKHIISPPRLEQVMDAACIPFQPAKLGYTKAIIEDALLCAKEIRDRYTILSLLDDLSLLEHFCHVILGKAFLPP